MDQSQNNTPVQPQPTPVAPHERKVGPIVGALIIVLVLIIAALYFFGSRLNTEPVDTAASQNNAVASVPASGESDDVASIEADLNTTLEDVDYSF